MNSVKQIAEEDIPELMRIHDKFFKHEFTFADFCQPIYASFMVKDEKDEIVTAGAIRPIIEMVAISNLDKSARLRMFALYNMLHAAQNALRGTSFNSIHAFIQDEKWLNQMLNRGFKRCVGTPLFIGLGD